MENKHFKLKMIGNLILTISIIVFIVSMVIANVVVDMKNQAAIVGVLSIIGIITSIVLKSKSKKVQRTTLSDKLTEAGLQITRRIRMGGGYDEFLIDDTHKIFVITQGDNALPYNYSDLLDYDLQEDGNTITQGRGAVTVVGGLAFGVVGAMVGASGKRKNESTCSSLILRIRVNSLDNPQIIIPYIKKEVMKNSVIYTSAKNQAESLVSLLTYIQNRH